MHMAPFSRRLLKQIRNKSIVEVEISTDPRRTEEKSLVEEVKAKITNKNLQNVVDDQGNILLHHTAKMRNAVITKYLLDLGNHVDVQNDNGKTPLMLAIKKACCEDVVEDECCKDTIEILINAGASVFITDKRGISAFKMFGSKKLCREKEIMEIILKKCDLPNDNEIIVDKLLECKWPLSKVVLLRNADLTKMFLERKYSLDIDEKDKNIFDITALHIATQIAHAENVKVLLSYNAHILPAGEDNLKPLAYVYQNYLNKYADERLEILKIFLERDNNYTNMGGKIDKNFVRLLPRACKEGVELLLQTGLDLSFTDVSGDTVVHLLASNENPGVIELLRGRNFDVNARNNHQQTPLIVAASCGIPNAVEFLLTVGADIEAMDDNGMTALFRAIYDCATVEEKRNALKYRDCFQVLLERSANTHIVNSIDGNDLTILDNSFNWHIVQYPFSTIALSHLALQEALEIPITQLCRTRIDSRDGYKSNFELSQQVLANKIYKNVTLLDLLMGSERKLESYVCRKYFCMKINNFIEKCEFHYFKAILQKRMTKAIKRMSIGKKIPDRKKKKKKK